MTNALTQRDLVESHSHQDSFTLLHLQPYNSIPVPFVGVSHDFKGLTAGTYLFEIGDRGGDGICCKFGQGSISITTQNDKVLWEHSGEFVKYLGVTLDIDKTGKLREAKESTEWTSSAENATKANSENYVNDPENEDEDWPGDFPKTANSLTVNIKHDSKPLEARWSICYLKETATVATRDGKPQRFLEHVARYGRRQRQARWQMDSPF